MPRRKEILDEIYKLTNLATDQTIPYSPKTYRHHPIQRLLRSQGNPHLRLKCFHAAGTKGKGSTCAFLAALLEARGFSTGLYLSPQLIDERDRYRIHKEKPTWSELLDIFELLLSISKKKNIRPTVFDIFTAAAFILFDKNQVDYAVIETGLGGRLDSTNIVEPLASIITPIDLDHTQRLGKTIEKIAREKAGIIKKTRPVFVSRQTPAAKRVLKERAKKADAPLFFLPTVQTSPSHFQGENFHLAEKTFSHFFPPPTKKERLEALKASLPGRCQKFGNIFLDGAHNSLSFKKLIEVIEDLSRPSKRIRVIFYCLPSKDAQSILATLPIPWDVILYRLRLPFLANGAHLKKIQSHPRVRSAINTFWDFEKIYCREDVFVVCGSFYLVGTFLRREKRLRELIEGKWKALR